MVHTETPEAQLSLVVIATPTLLRRAFSERVTQYSYS